MTAKLAKLKKELRQEKAAKALTDRLMNPTSRTSCRMAKFIQQ
jgi:hypothetical protein